MMSHVDHPPSPHPHSILHPYSILTASSPYSHPMLTASSPHPHSILISSSHHPHPILTSAFHPPLLGRRGLFWSPTRAFLGLSIAPGRALVKTCLLSPLSRECLRISFFPRTSMVHIPCQSSPLWSLYHIGLGFTWPMWDQVVSSYL